MLDALAVLLETDVEKLRVLCKLTVVCAAADIEFCVAKSGCESRPRCESHPAGCESSLCQVVYPMTDPLDLGKEGIYLCRASKHW